jgi:hypothetical protein
VGINPTTLPFLDFAISEMQETSHWPTHGWNVMREQRKPNRQHPYSDYREREKTKHSAPDECDTSRHAQPYRALPTKAIQITAHQARNVILETIHFLLEIENPHHPRLSSMQSIRSCDYPPIKTP